MSPRICENFRVCPDYKGKMHVYTFESQAILGDLETDGQRWSDRNGPACTFQTAS